MQDYWNNTYQQQPPHSVGIEHRLTVVEVEAKAAKTEAREAKSAIRQHGRRITVLEGQQSKRQPWNPRDYLMAAAGIVMVLAALAEKIGWTTAAAGLLKLYGVR